MLHLILTLVFYIHLLDLIVVEIVSKFDISVLLFSIYPNNLNGVAIPSPYLFILPVCFTNSSNITQKPPQVVCVESAVA